MALSRRFRLLRGLPIERHDDELIATIDYDIGLYLGAPEVPNPRGVLIEACSPMGVGR